MPIERREAWDAGTCVVWRLLLKEMKMEINITPCIICRKIIKRFYTGEIINCPYNCAATSIGFVIDDRRASEWENG